MRLCRLLLVSTALAALPAAAHAEDPAAAHSGDTAPARADDKAPDPQATQDVVVTGTLNDTSSSATGLPLTIMQTPQTISIIDRQRIEDFALNNVNDLLDQVPGINVERVETDRTQYNARGFDITSFQVDGIGLPLTSEGIQFGDLDTALWERVDIVQGANAMMTGVGNPSATINFVRKRPTPDFQASLTGELGLWNDKRVEADISGPLNRSGTLEARLIFAHENHDSYLDFNHVNRDVYGALVSWNITPRLKATIGYTRQQNDSRGTLWGALPLSYSDGTQIFAYPQSASTSAPWTYWNTRDQSAFGEAVYDLSGGWSLKGTFTFHRLQQNAKLLYAYGYPDPDTGLGIYGMSGIYPSDYKQYLIDAVASGPFHVFGREHQLVLGVSNGYSHGREYEGFSLDEIAYPDLRTLGPGTTIPEPSYPEPTLQTNLIDRITRVYGATHLNLTDRLKAVAGASAIWVKTTGSSYQVDDYRKNSKVSPYAGLLYSITPNVTLYASYTNIFDPQSETDADNRRLDPATGDSYEGGIKSQWFGGKLYATATLFWAKQKNLATAIGTFGDGVCGDNGPVGGSCYAGINTTSKGFEVELGGRITDHWSVSGGYTGYELTDDAGADPRPYLPNRTLKFSTTYLIPRLNDLKLGAQLRWQDGAFYEDSGVQTADGANAIVRQNSYAVLDLMAGIRVIDHVKAALNVRNVTDHRYLGSLMWGQAYYAAPRSFSVSLTVDY